MQPEWTSRVKERLANDTGVQLRLKNGGIVNIFDNGTCNVRGKARKRG